MNAFRMVRWVLGLVLAVAAVMKGHQLATEPIPDAGPFGARGLLIVWVEIEGLFAIWLMSGIAAESLRRAAIVLWILLFVGAAHKTIAGDASCGCFGRWPVAPSFVAAFDLLAAIGLMCAGPAARDAMRRPALPRVALVAAISVMCAVPGAVAMAIYRPATLDDDGSLIGGADRVWLEPRDWLGRRCPLIPHLKASVDLGVGDWTVVLADPDCQRCRAVLAAYEELAAQDVDDLDESHLVRRVAVIFVTPPSAARPGDDVPASIETSPATTFGQRDGQATASARSVAKGELSGQVRWYASLPFELILQNGIVTQVRTPT